MKPTWTQWSLLPVVLAMIALAACGRSANESRRNEGPLPVIEAQIGDTWGEVTQHSTLKLGPLPTPAGTIINEPHTFIYRDPRHRMQLDNVGYTGVAFKQETRRILDFGIGPYRESARADETWQRLTDISSKMERANWIADEQRNARNPGARSAVELRNQYIHLPGGARGVEKFWYDDYGNEAWVMLVKTITGEDPGEEPRFNVVLQIYVATRPKAPIAPN